MNLENEKQRSKVSHVEDYIHSQLLKMDAFIVGDGQREDHLVTRKRKSNLLLHLNLEYPHLSQSFTLKIYTSMLFKLMQELLIH